MIIALNNKSNLEKNRFREYQKELSTINTFNKMIVCPTFLNISNYNLNNFSLGAQNVSINDNGAYTGEISASQLKSFGVEYAIVGHSERRQYQKETNDEINKKVNNLLENDIIPILCIGETREERESGKVKEVLIKELLTAVENVNDEDKEKIIIAYEPIWAIGTGIIPTKSEIEEVFQLIKKNFPKNKDVWLCLMQSCSAPFAYSESCDHFVHDRKGACCFACLNNAFYKTWGRKNHPHIGTP